MDAAVKLFWSAHATTQYLEADAHVRQIIDICVDLIRQFPLIGARLIIRDAGHRRRFVCSDYQIIYDLKKTTLADMNNESSDHRDDIQTTRSEITIWFTKRT